MATYNIRSVEDLWRARYNDRYTLNGTYILHKDLNMGASSIYIDDPDIPGEKLKVTFNEWYPMGAYPWPIAGGKTENEEVCFTGTFEGNGHTIRNIHMSSTATDVADTGGFFGFVGDDDTNSTGTIRNLNIEDSDFEGEYAMGALVGFIISANIENCHIKNVEFYGDPEDSLQWGLGSVGGLGGDCYALGPATSITNCTVDGMTCPSVGNFIGGFLGDCYGGEYPGTETFSISNCSAINVVISGDDSGLLAEFSANWIGGFTGYCDAVINKCYCEAIIEIDSLYDIELVGGFAGETEQIGAYVTNCYCVTDITLDAVSGVMGVGGFTGSIGRGANILTSYCYTILDIDTSLEIGGGFSGQYHAYSLWGSEASIVNCFAVTPTTISGSKTDVGGFIGYATSASGDAPTYGACQPLLTDNAYWTENMESAPAIDTIMDTFYYPRYIDGGYHYLSNTKLRNSSGGVHYITTKSFTSMDLVSDVWLGNLEVYVPTDEEIYSYSSSSNLEDDGWGFAEDDAEALANGDHNVYRYDSFGSRPYRWNIYPNNTYMTPTTATWFEQYWLTYIYPTFENPGPRPPIVIDELPVNFYTEPSGDPVNFYQRW